MNKKHHVLYGTTLILACLSVFIGLILVHPQPTPETATQLEEIQPTADKKSASNNDALVAQNNANNADTKGTDGNAAPYGADDKIVRNDKNEPTIITSDGKAYPLRVYKPLLAPNDPYANQWWTGSTGLPSAWDRGAGSYQTTVAVIDSGFALQHEEFNGRWHTNTGEQGATTLESPSGANCTSRGLAIDKSCNNIDDDKNGLVDDVRGWDFSNSDNSVQAGETNPSGTATAHGTMVSGVLAATGNNGVGIAGVNWSTKILPIQALDDDSYGDTLTLAQSVRYAADQNADIISISLGSESPDPYLREALGYAIESGSLIVAASGNDGCDCMSYPAYYPEVVAVGSSNSSNARSSFSSYGANLDIVAPGENITTPTWTSSRPSNAYQPGVDGTSFSTPYVAGVLALAKSHQPTATWGELTAALTESSGHTGLTTTSPHSALIGFGYAHAGTLLGRMTTPDTPLIRYQFGPVAINDSLDTHRIYQCENGRFPTTRVYELTQNGALRFTTSELERHAAVQIGWASKFLFYSCVGLPEDEARTLRTINLPREIYNRNDKQ